MFHPDSVRQAYDLASAAYAEKFLRELDDKPFDRELLREFASLVGQGKRVLDIGCGPGHTTAVLTSLGLHATGLDLSPKMIEVASRTFPDSRFAVGDFMKLANEHDLVDGILAFYCIVHLDVSQLVDAFTAFANVLNQGGWILLGFHGGDRVIHAENFLGTTAELDFHFFEPRQVESALAEVGFASIDTRVREPYATEHPSQRCYIFARK